MNAPSAWDYRDTTVGLEGWKSQLEELRTAFLALAGGLDAEQFDWQPAPGKWSVGQILAHLNATNHEIQGPLRRALGTARAHGVTGHPPFDYGFLGRWFLDEVAPPPKHTARAPRRYVPELGDESGKDAVLAAFETQHAELLKLMQDADGLHLARVKMRSPALWLLNLPVGIWFASIPAHTARHLVQARTVRENPGFPRG